MSSLLDRMAWALRAHRNALQQGRPLPEDTKRITEAALAEYETGRQQDREDAHRVMQRITDPANDHG